MTYETKKTGAPINKDIYVYEDILTYPRVQY